MITPRPITVAHERTTRHEDEPHNGENGLNHQNPFKDLRRLAS